MLYLKIALHELLNGGIEGIKIEKIASSMKLDQQRMEQCFCEGDKELLMDTVEYAGKYWVGQIKRKIEDTDGTNDKIKILVREYVSGSETFPASLSIYIDLWQIIKDREDPYIKDRLKLIYQMYIAEFQQIVSHIGDYRIEKKDMAAFSMVMTILSDVLHIQSIVLENDVDFASISRLLEEWAEYILTMPEKSDAR